MPAINSSRGRNLTSFFEEQFAQQQNPFQSRAGQATGGLLDQFSGVSRNANGAFNFGAFSEDQFRIGRGVALDQFFDPRLSGQQEDAASAVSKNRVARGLRGRAADAAGENTRSRFLQGNQRAALNFIKQDLNRGFNAQGEAEQHNAAAIRNNLPGFNRTLTQDEVGSASAFADSADLLSRGGAGGTNRAFEQLDRFIEDPSALNINDSFDGFYRGLNDVHRGEQTLAGSTAGLAGADQLADLQSNVDQLSNDPFIKLATLLGIRGGKDDNFGAELGRRGELLRNTLFNEQRALPDSSPGIGTSLGSGPRGNTTQAGAENSFQQQLGRGQSLGSIEQDLGTIQARLDGDVKGRGSAALQGANAGFARASLGQTSDRTGAARFNTDALLNQQAFLQSQQGQLEHLRTSLFSPFQF